MIGVLNINRIMVLGLHVIILSQWAALNTVHASPFKDWKEMCMPVLAECVSPGILAVWKYLFFSNWEWQYFGCYSFSFSFNYANFRSGILIDTFSAFHTRLLPAVGVPFLVSYIRGVSPTLLPSLQHVWFLVWGVWNRIRMVLILLLFICSFLRLLCRTLFWNFKGIVKSMLILFLLKYLTGLDLNF